MSPKTVKGITIYRGDTFALTVRCFSNVAKTTTVDVHTRTYTAQLRTKADATADTVFTVDATNAATGIIVLGLAAATTAALSIGVYVMDFQQTLANGAISTLWRATVFVEGDVTR